MCVELRFRTALEIPAKNLENHLTFNIIPGKPISMHAPTSDMVEQLIPLANALDMKFIGIGMETMCSMMTQFMHLPAN